MEKRYPLLFPAAGFAAGLLFARVDSVSFTMLAVTGGISLVCIFLNIRRVLFMALAAGVLWGTGALFADGWRAGADASWIGQPVEITARVRQVDEQPVRSRIRLSEIVRRDGHPLAGDADIYLYGSRRQLLPGQKLHLLARLHRPSSLLNPGGFDYEAYCFDRHIALVGSATGTIEIVDEEISWLEQARQRLRVLLKEVPERERGVLLALILADRSRIPVAMEEHFAASGAAHLLAISGLHVGLVAGWVFVIAWWLLTRREAWIINLPVRSVALAAGLVAAIAYATYAGWPLPTQRAVMMALAGTVAWWMRRRNRPLNTLCAALLAVLLIDPAAITSVSLWLSFAAVAALLLWPAARDRAGGWRGRLLGLFWVSLIATLATLPVIAYVFGRIPTYSLVANLIMVPLYAVWVLPMALAGTLLALIGADSLAVTLLACSGAGVEAGSTVLAELYRWPAGHLWVADVSLTVTWLYGAGLAGAIHLWRRRAAWGAATAALVVVLYVAWVVPEYSPLQPQLYVWDVGQGASAAMVLPQGEVMVIDAPGRYGSRFNGGTIAAAGLRSTGVAHADVLVLSHAQSDHAGGAMRLPDRLRSVRELWLADVPANRRYRPMRQVAERITAQGGTVRWLKRGDRLQFGDAGVEVLWPPAGYMPINGNNASLVLSVTLRERRILLPGDMEGAVEAALVADGLGRHDLVLMPHHGSRTSSTAPFVRTVAPGLAIAQVGRFNRYGFPHTDVVRRYSLVGAKVWRSGEGAIRVVFGENGPETEQFQPRNSDKRVSALQWWR